MTTRQSKIAMPSTVETSNRIPLSSGEIVDRIVVLASSIPRNTHEMEVDEKYLTKREKENGEIYDFCNGKSLTWRDIKHDSLTWNLHEG